MYLVYNWYDDRYLSEAALLGNSLAHSYDLKVKVTELEPYCQSFVLKFLTVHIFQTIWWLVLW